MPKTILHVAKYYYPDEGGIETVTKYLVEGLTDFRNIVICYATDGKTRTDNLHGVVVKRVAPMFQVARQDVALSYYRHLKELIDTYQPDIINVHCPNPYVYPIVSGLKPRSAKLVLLWHSDILTKGMLYKAIKPVERNILKKADLILATSPNYVHPSSPIFQYKDKVKIVPNGVIADELEMQAGDEEEVAKIREKYDGKPLILFVGRHIPYKGIDLLIEAEKHVKHDCRLLIAGRGPKTAELKRKAQSDRVIFLGKVSDDELRRLYHAADIFGFSSVTKQEAFGVALAEAMYCRCVPVTFEIEGSGVNWLSPDGKTGEVVPLRDVEAYAAAIDKILGNKDLKQQYAEAAHRRVADNFTSKKVAAEADKIFNQLLEG